MMFLTTPGVRNLFDRLGLRGLGVIWYKFECFHTV